jgi:tRNA(Ile)-lysidine synthase
MKWISPSPADGQIQLVRPLLNLHRQEIEQYARHIGIPFRCDSTNTQIAYDRNRIRHQLLPLLRSEFQPGVDKSVLRLMQILRAESEFLAEALRRAQSDRPMFQQLPIALQRRWLQSECVRLGITPDFELIEKLRSSPVGRAVMFGPEQLVRRDDHGNLRLRQVERPAFNAQSVNVDLRKARGRVLLEGAMFSWTRRRWRGWSGQWRASEPGCERFDADKIGQSIRLRHWQAGDRFRPIGMSASVKLQDLFTNARIPRSARPQLVIAEAERGEIFWVEGLRISEKFKITEATKTCLVWRVVRRQGG